MGEDCLSFLGLKLDLFNEIIGGHSMPPPTPVNVYFRVGLNSENGPNTEYRIIQFLKTNKYQISNSTIQSQLFEYRIL